MRYFLIQVSFNAPYPKRKDYEIKASNIIVAISRGARLFRQEYKGKRVKELSIKALAV